MRICGIITIVGFNIKSTSSSNVNVILNRKFSGLHWYAISVPKIAPLSFSKMKTIMWTWLQSSFAYRCFFHHFSQSSSTAVGQVSWYKHDIFPLRPLVSATIIIDLFTWLRLMNSPTSGSTTQALLSWPMIYLTLDSRKALVFGHHEYAVLSVSQQ